MTSVIELQRDVRRIYASKRIAVPYDFEAIVAAWIRDNLSSHDCLLELKHGLERGEKLRAIDGHLRALHVGRLRAEANAERVEAVARKSNGSNAHQDSANKLNHGDQNDCAPESAHHEVNIEPAASRTHGSSAWVDARAQDQTTSTIEFLNTFLGDAAWPLVAIRHGDIKAVSFSNAPEREAAATELIRRWNEEEHYDLYFAINPLKMPLCRKASKADVAAAAWLWIDLDPGKNEEDAAAQTRLDAAMAQLPAGIPGRPTWEIHSGRGRWGFWKLTTQQPVDGKDGPETLRVEGHGRGVEQAYGKDVADNCRNIDRIARLPGTINHKTKRIARVTAYRPDRSYELADFPFVPAEERAKTNEAGIDPNEPGEKVDIDKLPVSERIRHMIKTGEDTDAPGIPYSQVRSERDFAVLIGMAGAGCSNETMAAVLLDATLPIGGHVRDQKKPREYLARQISKARAKVENGERSEPLGYQIKADGLYHDNKLLSAHFEILGRARDPNGQGWARWLRWKDEDGREHTWAVPDAKLHGDPSSLCGELAQQGLRIATSASKRALFIAYLNGADSDKRATIVGRTGWCELNDGKVFVLPARTIGVTGNETVSFVVSRSAPYGERGTLEQWRNSVGTLTCGHDRAMFAISSAFAAPLVGLAEAESGGFNFDGQSSIGKTSIVRAAASVWGRGDVRGFLRTWRATANGLEGAAVLHNDLPLILDEVGVADAKDVGGVIYSLTGERGKDRAQRDGSLKETQTWRTLIISTGELTIADKIREDGRRVRAGQEARVVDIHADAGAGFGVFNNAGRDNDAQNSLTKLRMRHAPTTAQRARHSLKVLLPRGSIESPPLRARLKINSARMPRSSPPTPPARC